MRLLLTIALSFTVVFLQAQKDRLYLKDRKTLEGNVVNLQSNSIQFAINSGETVLVDAENVIGYKAKGYKPGASSFKQLSDSLNAKYQKGPRLQVGLGLLHDDSGKSSDLNGMLGLDITYRFGQYVQFGWGFAYHQYELIRSIPVYFTYQGDLTFKKSDGPYYFINVGKSTAWGNDECNCKAGSVKAGLYLSGGLGYRWDLGGKSFYVQGGWLQERITTSFSNENIWGLESRLWAPNDNSTIIRQKLNSFSFQLGISFN